VIFGNADGEPETLPPGDRLRTSVKSILGWSITGLAAVAPERVARISAAAFAVVERGEITVDITATLTLAEAGSAHRLMEARRSTGKLVLAVGAR
jgi:NADPH2:quinone reductase